MRLLRNLSIQRKLTVIAMATSGAALLLACLAFVSHELFAFRERLVEQLATTAAMVSENSSAALAFDDPESATRTLRSLSAHPHIVEAAIYDWDGEVFATYARDGVSATVGPVAPEADGHRFAANHLTLTRGIKLAGERAGAITIRSDLNEMRARLRQYGLIVLLVMIGAALAAFLLTRKLRSAISGPISHLAETVGMVAKYRDYSVRAMKESEDELGQLMDGFNGMLDQIQRKDSALEDARRMLEERVAERTAKLRDEIAERERAQAELETIHRQLITASRHAGMAEVATNVLHNVGNVLNSVNVSAILVADLARKSRVSGLERVVALMRERAPDLANFITQDARGKHLPTHLANLSEHLAAEQQAIVTEVESLRANIEHIKEIVTMQQSYAKVAGVREIVDVVALVEDSLRMNAGALDRHQIELIRDFQSQPRVNVDKHKVLQILVNLVRNAKYACDESNAPDRRVTLRVLTADERVRISVIDNGVGIAPENLRRIFNHGFTTRAAGHGFGLHSGALAARELGGSLTVHSDGVGRGATFTLELRLQPAEMTNAA